MTKILRVVPYIGLVVDVLLIADLIITIRRQLKDKPDVITNVSV